MISKNILAVALASLPFAAGVAHAGSPLIPLNDDGSAAIFFVADASVVYNDNIFYQNSKTGDTIFTVAPGFELVAGGDGNSKFNLVFKEAMSAYVDHSNLNSQLANVDAKYTYDADTAFKATVTAGFHQTQQPTNQTRVAGDIVKSDTFNGGANGEYKATEKSTIALGVNYNGTRYTSYQNLFNDLDTVGVPVSWYYAVTDKLDAGFTYQYTHSEIYKTTSQTGPAFRDGTQDIHFAGLTARGAVTDKFKLEANAGVGFSSLESVTAGVAKQDSTTFNFALKSSYAITEKLSATLGGGREFAVAAQGQQTTTTHGEFGLNYAITEDWSANTNVGYMVQDFGANSGVGGIGSRQDRIITAGVGAAYKLNKYVSFAAAYTYMHDDMNQPGDFDTNVITLSASVKY